MSKRKVTKEELQSYFGYSMYEACILLKLEINEMKQLCRDYEIPRWPKKKSSDSKNQIFQSFNVPKKNLKYGSQPLQKQIAPKKIVTLNLNDTNSNKFSPQERLFFDTSNPNSKLPEFKINFGNVNTELKVNDNYDEKELNSELNVERNSNSSKLSIQNLLN